MLDKKRAKNGHELLGALSFSLFGHHAACSLELSVAYFQPVSSVFLSQ
jgi:hypothetical protein